MYQFVVGEIDKRTEKNTYDMDSFLWDATYSTSPTNHTIISKSDSHASPSLAY